MAKTSYMPRNDKSKGVWMNNFNGKIAVAGPGLGLSAADITSAGNDTLMAIWLINVTDILIKNKEQRVAYKSLILNGPLGQVAGAAPVASVLPAMPTAVAPGIFPRIGLLVQRIKTSPTYTDAIGKDLGIIGAEQTVDTDTMKPTLKLMFKGGHVEVQWAKGDADAIRIEVDRGAGTWQFLAIDTVPHYPDTTPITAPGTWKYRAMYLVADEPVGQWSDVISIAVG